MSRRMVPIVLLGRWVRGKIVTMRRYLNELYKRKDLILYLVTSGLKAQHRNTFLGYSSSIAAQAGIITQVYLPKAVFPLGATLTQQRPYVSCCPRLSDALFYWGDLSHDDSFRAVFVQSV